MRTSLISKYIDEARSLRYEAVRDERVEMLQTAGHMSSLLQFVAKLRLSVLEVPHFDPLDGGNESRVLFLQHPSV